MPPDMFDTEQFRVGEGEELFILTAIDKFRDSCTPRYFRSRANAVAAGEKLLQMPYMGYIKYFINFEEFEG